MHRLRVLSWSILPCLWAVTAWGQEGAILDPEVIRLHLMDGSVITGKLSVKEIELQTKFGVLKVPIASIKSFTPGLDSHPELGKQVFQLIDKLGSANYDERESAQRDLLKMGEQVRPELEKRRDDSDNERRTRIRALLEELDEAGEEEPKPNEWLLPGDTVETTDFTAVGKILTASFKMESLYGPLEIKLGNVRRGERNTGGPSNLVKEITIDSSNLVQRALKETSIRLEKGERVTISADGSIGMTPWGQGATSTPDGAGNFGWLVQGQIPAGALVATVGNNKQWIKIGSRNEFRAPRTGTLRLGVAMQQDYANQEFPGGYNVKITVERKKN